MRWDHLAENPATARDAALFGVETVRSRTFGTPEFRGMTFHEVRARTILDRVPGASRMPFEWTVNPCRGCSHAWVRFSVAAKATGSTGWVRSRAGTRVFSSTESTAAPPGGARYRPTTSATFSANAGSFEILKVPER